MQKTEPKLNSSHKETKKWEIKDIAHRERFEFFPESVVTEQTDGVDVEPRFVHVKIGEKTYTFNWLDLYMFVYFCSTDSMRQKLAIIAERKVEYIPYELSFVLSPEEKRSGTAHRRGGIAGR